jgi:hypothetical protein
MPAEIERPAVSPPRSSLGPCRKVERLGTGSAGWLGTTRLPDAGATVALLTLPAARQSQERPALEDAPCPLQHALPPA